MRAVALSLLAALAVWLAAGAVVALVTRAAAWRQWVYQLFIAADQLLNILATPWHGGAWADETLSSRAWRMDRDGKPWGRVLRPLIDALFAWQRAPGGHCKQAYERERARIHQPPELRGCSITTDED